MKREALLSEFIVCAKIHVRQQVTHRFRASISDVRIFGYICHYFFTVAVMYVFFKLNKGRRECERKGITVLLITSHTKFRTSKNRCTDSNLPTDFDCFLIVLLLLLLLLLVYLR
jgi:hypothetical protein